MLDTTTAFATFPVLTTERFVLRQPTLADAPAMFHIMRDPQVMRYFGSLPMTSEQEAIDRVTWSQTAFAEHSGIRWAISDRDTGQLLGSVGFWRLIKPHDRAEVGYELAPEWWGRGVMPEALAAVLTWGFTTLRLHSVEAQIHPANTGSRRVLEKLGFVQEGYFREHYYDPLENRFTDTAVFSLLQATWLSRADRQG